MSNEKGNFKVGHNVVIDFIFNEKLECIGLF